MSDSKSKGKVKWFNKQKGFGFITSPEHATDIFVHHSQIESDKPSEKFKYLNDGDEVEFYVVEGQKGLCANEVTKL